MRDADKMARAVYNNDVGQGSKVIAPANAHRWGVVIGMPTAATVWINFGAPAAPGQGIPLRPNTSALNLCSPFFGAAIREEITAYCEAGTEHMGVLDIFG